MKRNWVEAPASTTARDGLGPHFLARSCAGCHLFDGRSRYSGLSRPRLPGERELLRIRHPEPMQARAKGKERVTTLSEVPPMRGGMGSGGGQGPGMLKS